MDCGMDHSQRARNSIQKTGVSRLYPDICARRPFLEFVIREWLKQNREGIEGSQSANCADWLKNAGMNGSHLRSVNRARAVNVILDRTLKRTLKLEHPFCNIFPIDLGNE